MRILVALLLVAPAALALPPVMAGASAFVPASVPGTVALLDAGKRMVWNANGYITSWASAGAITGANPNGMAVLPANGQVVGPHGLAITTGLTATAGTYEQPITAYLLVAPRERTQILDGVAPFFQHQTSDPSKRYRIRGTGNGTGVTISVDAGRFRTDDDSAIVGPTVPPMTWVRVRAVWNGASSLLTVEGTDYEGTLTNLYGGIAGDIVIQNCYVAYWHFISGAVSDANHARIWSHMTQLKALMPDYSRAVVVRPFTSGLYAAFGSVSRTAGGTLAAVYRAGTTHITVDGHIDLQTSADDGATWTAPATIYTPAAGWDARDATITCLSSGRWLVTFFLWDGATTRLPRVIYSDDDGATWSAVVTPSQTTATLWTACSAPAEELTSGDLIWPAYAEPDPTASRIAIVFRSTDDGETWAEDSTRGLTGNADEPVVRQLADGRLLMLIRVSGTVYKSYSENVAPLVWSAPVAAFLGDSAPRFVQRASGEIVATVRGYAAYRTATSQQAFAVYRSSDLGVTWKGPEYPHPNWHGFMYGSPIEIAGTLYALWFVEGGPSSATYVYWETI